MQLGAYEAADGGRLADLIAQTTYTALDVEGNRKSVVNQSRHAVRNTPLAASAKLAYQRRCVGGEGITSRATIRNPYTGDTLTELQERVDADFDEWASTPELCDFHGRATLLDLEHQGVGEWFETGEALSLWDYLPQPDRVGLRIRMLEPELLSDWPMQSPVAGNEIVDGIEIDPFGRRVAYYLGNDVRPPARVDADRVNHVFLPHRAGAVRGIPRLAPVLRSLHHFSRYIEYTVLAAQTQACAAIQIKRDKDGDWGDYGLAPGTGDNGLDAYGNREFIQAPGMVFDNLLPGEEMDMMSPNQPQGVFAPFTEAMGALIAAAVGLDLPTILRNYNGANYSSLRQGLLEFINEIATVIRVFADQQLRPWRQQWTHLSIVEGRYQGLVGSEYWTDPRWRRAYLSMMWSGPNVEWVDPLKDAQADAQELLNGSTTKTEQANKRGRNVEDLIRQRGDEQRRELEDRVKTVELVMEHAQRLGVNPAVLMPGASFPGGENGRSKSDGNTDNADASE